MTMRAISATPPRDEKNVSCETIYSITVKRMSQIPGLVFLITREGEEGKIGPIFDAIQALETSPMIAVLTTAPHRYYLGAKEEYETFMHDHQNPNAVAGDVDGDNDRDADDAAKVRELNDENR